MREERPSRTELGRSLLETHALSSDWAPTFAAIDRAAFLPDLMWPFNMETGTSVAVDRRTDADAWYTAADSNLPIVTQWDDGKHTGTAPGRVSTSSSSMPSVVYRLLGDLDVQPGMDVYDGGTGSGETAAALTHRSGPGKVTTADVDRAVSLVARERLARLGLYPHFEVGNATGLLSAGEAFDRVLITFGLRDFGDLVKITRPGGVIVAPYGTHYSNADAVARLTVKDSTAQGRFLRPVEFMKDRAQRRPDIDHAEYAPEDSMEKAATSTTTVTEAEFVTSKYTAVSFALGLRVRDCVQAVADKRGGARPVWFYGLTDRSWACVMFRDREVQARVWQSGPRRLWDEVEAAYRWWVDRDRPAHDRFGLTITPDGHRAWLDDPSHSWTV